MKSEIQERGYVPFPDFKYERHYMVPFVKSDGLPELLAHWQPTVDAMLDGVEANQVYLMVDQSLVKRGETHRRPGVHIDGYWTGSDHQHVTLGWDTNNWSYKAGDRTDTLLLASDAKGCAAYVGEWNGVPGEGGDCGDIKAGRLNRIVLSPNRCYSGDAMQLLHESIPLAMTTTRTLVRLNVSCP